LIPLLGDEKLTVDVLRPENEEIVIREFERFAAGGLEYLVGVLEDSAGRSIDMVVQSLAALAAKPPISIEKAPDLLS
jgi:hypothetical protein